MITLLVVLLIATAIRRGYRQGAPRELIDLIVVVVGIPIAFRTGAPIGEWLFGDRAPLASRTLGALVVFGGISLIGLAPRRALGHASLDVGERRLGAAIGAIRSSIVSVIIVAVVAAVPATSTLGAMAQRSQGRVRHLRPQRGDHDLVPGHHRGGRHGGAHRVQPRISRRPRGWRRNATDPLISFG